MASLGTILALILTVMVFSYIFGDNVLFKLATHIFVGVALGYATIVIIYQVFIPAITTGPTNVTILGFLLCLFLLFKMRFIPQNAWGNTLGSITLAFVLGVGAALAIGGALFGSLIPQVSAAIVSFRSNADFDPVQVLDLIIITLGTLGTLYYFMFVVRNQGPLSGLREGWVRFWAGIGRLMIIFTLGALFANTVGARVALLISRLQFLLGG